MILSPKSAKIMLKIISCLLTVCANADSCQKYINMYELKHQIPTGLLRSIGEIESNLKQNALHHAGHGYQFKTKISAYTKINELLAIKETNFDIGCMQINYHWHKYSFKSAYEMLDPDKNVSYGANLLSKLYSQSGSWHEAVKLYHSRNPSYNRPYARKVALAWLSSD